MIEWLAGKAIGPLVKAAAPYLAYLILAAVLVWLWTSNQSLNQTIGELETQLSVQRTVNAQNQTELTEALDANRECIANFEAAQQRSEQTIENLRTRFAQLEVFAGQIRVEREVIFREPSCRELGQIDIDAVCPALSERVRRQSTALR